MKTNHIGMRHGILSILTLFMAVSCGESVVEDAAAPLETTTIHFIPEELDIDVEPASRAVLGETDIYCYAFVDNMLVEGYPAKQTEINNGVYSFIIPKSSNTRLCFVIKPDWLGWKTSSGNVIFDIWWMNREEIELYSSYSQWYDTSSEGVQTISASLNQQHYDIHLRFQFINFPSDPKDVIKDLYLTLSNAVGLNFSLDELQPETEGGVEYLSTDLHALIPSGSGSGLYAEFYTVFGVRRAYIRNITSVESKITVTVNYENLR